MGVGNEKPIYIPPDKVEDVVEAMVEKIERKGGRLFTPLDLERLKERYPPDTLMKDILDDLNRQND